MQDEYYPETNDRFSIYAPAIEEALIGIRDKVGGSGGSGASTGAYMENYLETNDRFSISSPVIEELLWEIRDAIGGGSTSSIEIVMEDGEVTGYSFSAVIPDGVTSIGEGAFYYCSSLTQITIPDSLTSIGEGAFSKCTGLAQINLPGSLTTIGDYAFSQCSGLEQITLPDSITSIGAGAFSGINANAVINCGFAEGAVTGAPWGAPDTVTINYNVPQP